MWSMNITLILDLGALNVHILYEGQFFILDYNDGIITEFLR